MGFISWLRGTTTRSADEHTIGSSYSFLFDSTTAGRTVTERSAMQMTAVYSCVRILAEAWATRLAVREALTQLGEEDCLMVVGIHMHGFTQAEVTVHLGVSQPAVAKRLRKAESRLRELLD